MSGAGGVRAGRAYVEIGADPRQLQSALRDIQKGIGQLGRNLQVAGGAMVAAGAAVVGSISGAAVQFAATGDAIAKMSARTGIAVETLSAMSFAAEQSGADLQTFEKGIRRMQSTINDAGMGLSSATDSLAALGLNISDLEGLSPDKQFEIIANALASVEDASLRAALAQRIFGRAGTALLPLMSAGAGGFAALRAEAERLGLVMDAETAKQAEVLTDAMNSLRRGFGAIAFQVGSAVAPVLSSLAQALSVVAGGVANFVKSNRELINRILQVAAGVTVAGGALIGLGTALRLATFGLGGIAATANAVLAPLRMVATGMISIVAWSLKAAVAVTAYAVQSVAAATATAAAWALANAPILAVGAALAAAGAVAVSMAGGFGALGQAASNALKPIANMATSAGSAIARTFGQVVADAQVVFGDLYNTATTTFGGISDALAVGDFGAAAEIAWLGLQAAWQRGVMAITSYTDPFIEYLQNVWGDVSTFTVNVFDAMFSNVQQGFRTGFAVVQGIVDNVINGIIGSFDALVTNIRVMWVKVQGLITGAKDTEQRVAQIRSEAAARAEQRAQQRPGFAGRLAAAGQANRQDQNDLRARQDARIAENQAAQDERRQRTEQAAAVRAAALDDTNQELKAKRQQMAAARAEAQQQAAGNTDAGAAGIDTAAPTARSEIAGTFSAAAVGGLGLGSSVMDRIAKATEQTAINTAAFSDPEVSE